MCLSRTPLHLSCARPLGPCSGVFPKFFLLSCPGRLCQWPEGGGPVASRECPGLCGGGTAWREKFLSSEVSSWLKGVGAGRRIETPTHNNAGDDIKTYTITALPRHPETTSRHCNILFYLPVQIIFKTLVLWMKFLEAAESTFSPLCTLQVSGREQGKQELTLAGMAT